jgi:hypothetical protein
VDHVAQTDPVGSAIRSRMASQSEWFGTASELLAALTKDVGERNAKAKTWLATPRSISGRVRRAATFLRKVGIDITFDREGRVRTRNIPITCTEDSAVVAPYEKTSSAPNREKIDQEETGTDQNQGRPNP